MAFELWNESDPAGGDPAGTLWDDIQQFKRQVRERLATVFSDFASATDRLTTKFLYTDAVDGITIKDATGATTYATITKDGHVNFLRPFAASVYKASVYSGTPGAGNWIFSGTPTEVFDPVGFHAGANPWRFTIPAGAGGTYKITLGVKHQQTGGTLNFPHSVAIYKNGSILESNSFVVRDTNIASYWFSPIYTLAAGDYVEPYFSAYSTYAYAITEAHFEIERMI